jgi:hypothetical protein
VQEVRKARYKKENEANCVKVEDPQVSNVTGSRFRRRDKNKKFKATSSGHQRKITSTRNGAKLFWERMEYQKGVPKPPFIYLDKETVRKLFLVFLDLLKHIYYSLIFVLPEEVMWA